MGREAEGVGEGGFGLWCIPRATWLAYSNLSGLHLQVCGHSPRSDSRADCELASQRFRVVGDGPRVRGWGWRAEGSAPETENLVLPSRSSLLLMFLGRGMDD